MITQRENTLLLIMMFRHVLRLQNVVGPWWRHQMETFSALLDLCVPGIHRSPVNSLHKGQWRWSLIFILSDWVNNRDVGGLRRHHAHYGSTVCFGATLVSNSCQWLFADIMRRWNEYFVSGNESSSVSEISSEDLAHLSRWLKDNEMPLKFKQPR